MRSILTIVAFSLLASTISAVQFSDCGSTVKDVTYKVSNCPDSEDQCPFVIGQDVTLESTFKASEEIKSAVIRVYGKIGPIPIPFPVKPDQACGNWGMTCPAAPGTVENLKITLPVDSRAKPINVGVRLEVWDDKKKLICTQFPAKLVNP